ncbi:hypothetical protein SAMN05421833_102459 [Microbispora rosea]|uniref:Antitoxin n=1 Tax=Microbispora rosea TaxID=58117 RepID=A0A1N6TRV4_9ACTN|nr:hypothetical protein [Microbispora rosea]GIH44965.1 hypothetical protein Mro03_01440 [Microbispora rosea subsp. rosea]SIQ56112.1 hypothetical protein SAMN05421833_102459 [Microbispora rosea]
MAGYIEVEPVSSASAAFAETVARMGEKGLEAKPVVVGRRGTPEAAIIPWALYQALLDEIDTVLSGAEIRDRLDATAEAGGPTYTSLEELANAAGVDVNELPDDPDPR